MGIMATNLMLYSKCSKAFLCKKVISCLGSIRNGFTLQLFIEDKKPKRSTFSVKKLNGESVKAGQILVRQLSLEYCPGLNVGINGKADLYAKVDGKILISTEKTNFDPNNYMILLKFPNYLPVYKTYFNVISNSPHKRFKLLEKI